MNHPDFPPFMRDEQPIESVLNSLEFIPTALGYTRKWHEVEFDICESLNCWFMVRAGVVTKRCWTTPHEIRIFPPIAPVELMGTIYRLWAEVYESKAPLDNVEGPIDSFLIWGKEWLDYQKEIKALFPPIPTIWVEREFLRNGLNYIERQHDWVDDDYDIQFSQIPGQLRITAKNTEVYCPARGNLIGEVNVSAKALFRNLPKRFIGDVVSLQSKGNKLIIYSREFPARWTEQNDH